MRIEKILVPTDFSKNARLALAMACDLARQIGAAVYVLHVQDESSLRVAIKEGLLRKDSTDEELYAAVEQLNETRLTEMMSSADATGIQTEHSNSRGEPKAAIIDFALRISANLIVLGNRGAGATKVIEAGLLLGSVAEYVLRKSPCPVMVVRSDHHR
jgi:nucleotide-binding universal stress UspA family protein